MKNATRTEYMSLEGDITNHILSSKKFADHNWIRYFTGADNVTLHI